MNELNGLIIGLLIVMVYFGSMALLVLKFKRRTAELHQQAMVASQRKLDALHHVCHALFPNACAQFYERFTKNESFEENLFKVHVPKDLALTFADFEAAMKARLLRGTDVDLVEEAVRITPFAITVKNQLGLYPELLGLSQLVEAPENDFRRLMLLYRNEARALNKLIESPWTWVSAKLVRAVKYPIYDSSEGGTL